MTADGRVTEVHAQHTVLATGGAGQLFAVTTNPAEATADGLAMALRAGVASADVEFMQFHPTALHHPAMPRPLLSEALRGHGARLRDRLGQRFIDELAPRDVVSRAMAERMREEGCEHLWLDATGLDSFEERFPTIARSLEAVGLDPSVDWLPIAPAAHYLSGGVLTDLHGATALPGLWAAGEVACTGVHGANRLASNSLLEGMVFGARLAEAILAGIDGPSPTGPLADLDPSISAYLPSGEGAGTSGASQGSRGDGKAGRAGRAHRADRSDLADDVPANDLAKARDQLQRAMMEGAGVVRTADSLAAAGDTADSVAGMLGSEPTNPAEGELANLVTAARAVLTAATQREETRGAHARRDHPEQSEWWRRRIVQTGTGRTSVTAALTARSAAVIRRSAGD